MNQLEQIKPFSKIVADTGNIEEIELFLPEDATTNPSLILNLVETNPDFLKGILKKINDEKITNSKEILTHLIVAIGIAILKIIKGRVSIEVPAHLSFDKEGTIEEAKKIIAIFNTKGIANNRVLIKIAATYEGIEASEELEKVGIHCNLTLIFSFIQARYAADRGATLISPFVGRVLDWYQEKEKKEYSIIDDPGVNLVKNIYYKLKTIGFSTEIMAASFRKVEQILALVGCDLLTIAPKFLEVLKKDTFLIGAPLKKPELIPSGEIHGGLIEKDFRYNLKQDEMADYKLNEGIRFFDRDYKKLQVSLKKLAF